MPEPTIREARRALLEKMWEGTTCPCCGRYAKIYSRTLNAGMVADLERLYLEGGAAQLGWVSWRRVWSNDRGRGKEFQRMRFWGLIQQSDSEPGVWKVTPKGERFLLGLEVVPKRVSIFDGKKIGDDGTISVEEALGRQFKPEEVGVTA